VTLAITVIKEVQALLAVVVDIEDVGGDKYSHPSQPSATLIPIVPDGNVQFIAIQNKAIIYH